MLPNFSFTDLLPGIPFPDLALDPTADGSDWVAIPVDGVI